MVPPTQSSDEPLDLPGLPGTIRDIRRVMTGLGRVCERMHGMVQGLVERSEARTHVFTTPAITQYYIIGSTSDVQRVGEEHAPDDGSDATRPASNTAVKDGGISSGSGRPPGTAELTAGVGAEVRQGGMKGPGNAGTGYVGSQRSQQQQQDRPRNNIHNGSDRAGCESQHRTPVSNNTNGQNLQYDPALPTAGQRSDEGKEPTDVREERRPSNRFQGLQADTRGPDDVQRGAGALTLGNRPFRSEAQFEEDRAEAGIRRSGVAGPSHSAGQAVQSQNNEVDDEDLCSASRSPPNERNQESADRCPSPGSFGGSPEHGEAEVPKAFNINEAHESDGEAGETNKTASFLRQDFVAEDAQHLDDDDLPPDQPHWRYVRRDVPEKEFPPRDNAAISTDAIIENEGDPTRRVTRARSVVATNATPVATSSKRSAPVKPSVATTVKSERASGKSKQTEASGTMLSTQGTKAGRPQSVHWPKMAGKKRNLGQRANATSNAQEESRDMIPELNPVVGTTGWGSIGLANDGPNPFLPQQALGITQTSTEFSTPIGLTPNTTVRSNPLPMPLGQVQGPLPRNSSGQALDTTKTSSPAEERSRPLKRLAERVVTDVDGQDAHGSPMKKLKSESSESVDSADHDESDEEEDSARK